MGPLMIIGFLGALIGLERAVALDRLWPYGIPMLSGISALSALWGGLFNTLTILLFLINNIRVKVGATEELGYIEATSRRSEYRKPPCSYSPWHHRFKTEHDP